jgi:hypothetical protein
VRRCGERPDTRSRALPRVTIFQLCLGEWVGQSLLKQAGRAEQTVMTCAIYRRHSGGFFAQLCFNQNES